MLNVVKAVKEGIVIEGIEGKRGMVIPADLANLIGANYAHAVGQAPAAEAIKYQATLGRVHPLEAMMGMVEGPFQVFLRVFPLGTLEANGESIEMDLYLAEADGKALLAWCPQSERERIVEVSGTEDMGVMSMFGYDHEDHAELIELLSQDFSVLPADGE